MQGVFEFCRDLPRRPKRPERLFFALFPDAQTCIRAGRFAGRLICEHHLQGTRIKTERLHVSLHHVGDFKRLKTKFIYAARQAGNAVSMPPFEIAFRSVKSFDGAPSIRGRPRRQPLVLLGEGDALFELHDILGAAIEKYGLSAVARFTPHMTLFYGSKPIAMQAIEPIRCVINEFALVHSEQWLTQYNVVDRWSLRG